MSSTDIEDKGGFSSSVGIDATTVSSVAVLGSLWEWNTLKRKIIRLILRPFYPSSHVVMGTQLSTWTALRRMLVTPSFRTAWLYVCLPVTADKLSRSWKFHHVGLVALAGNPAKVFSVFPSISDRAGQDGFNLCSCRGQIQILELECFFSPAFVDPSSSCPGVLQKWDLYWCWDELSALRSHLV